MRLWIGVEVLLGVVALLGVGVWLGVRVRLGVADAVWGEIRETRAAQTWSKPGRRPLAARRKTNRFESCSSASPRENKNSVERD